MTTGTDGRARARRRGASGLLAIALATGLGAGLAGCAALPRGGPATADLVASGEGQDRLDGLVAPLTAEAAALAAPEEEKGFPAAFLAAGEIDPDRLGVDDVLDVTIWEGGEGGLLNETGGATTLEAIAVDGTGRVYIPFVGPVQAAGGTPEQLRERIRAALEPMTLTPQVDVRLRETRSRAVTVQGAVARPGLYVIDRPVARLTPLLALAGGASLPPEQTEVTLRRGALSGAVTLEDLYADAALDVALAPGDRIVLNAVRERFIVLGATRLQGEVAFPTRRLSLLRAIGAARGLIDIDADPTGVFVFRWEDPAVADALLAGPPPEGLPAGPGRPIVYRLNLTQPEALFTAQAFRMRDGDAIFVTNAPLTELRKFFQLFNTVLAPAQTATTLAN